NSGSQSIPGIVGDTDRLFFRVEGNDRKHRTKYFFLCDRHLVFNTGKDGWLDEKTFAKMIPCCGLSAASQNRTLRPGIRDAFEYPIELRLICNCSHLSRLLQWVAQPDLTGAIDEPIDDFVVNRAL